VIDQDKGRAMGKTNAAMRFLGRALTATCLYVAATHGAYAATLAESSLPLPDLSTTVGSAGVLPDGTTIMEAPRSINSATGRILFSNLTSKPALGDPASSGDASPGLEAFDGSSLLFTPEFDQEIFGAASVTFPANVSGNDMSSAGLGLDEEARNRTIPVNSPDAETADSASLALTCLGFALAGTVGRNPRVLRRLMGLENRHASEEPETEIAFYIETRRRMLSR